MTATDINWVLTMQPKVQNFFKSPNTTRVMLTVSFLESALLPLPVDAISIPVMLAQREKIAKFVIFLTISSICGGLVGYSIGYFAFSTVGYPIFEFYDWLELYNEFQSRFRDYGPVFILIGAVTPIPFKLVCIATGAAAYPALYFIMLSFIGRFARFSAIGLCLYVFSAAALKLHEKYPRLLTAMGLVLLILGFVAIPFI